MCLYLAHHQRIFATTTIHYCHTLEEALRRAKAAGKEPGCHYGGITLKSGRRGFTVYRDGRETVRYAVLFCKASL